MKTTLNIDEGVMRRLKVHAARTGTTMSELVDAALRVFLDRAESTEPVELPPLPTFSSGGMLVDIADRDALYDAMEAD